MAVSVSFFLAYTAGRIKSHRLEAAGVTVRCELRYTLDGLSWELSRRAGGQEKRYKFNLPVKAQPRYWQSGHAKYQDPQAPEINSLIDLVANRARDLHAQFLKKGAFPPPEDFAIQLLGGRQDLAEEKSFFGDYAVYIDFLENRGVSKVFISAQKLIRNTLRDFEKSTGYRLEYNRINKTFAAKFTAWAKTHLPRRRKNQDIDRTARKYLDDLKIFLNHALTEGWTAETGFKQIKISFKANPFPFTHTDAEIEALLAVTDDELRSALQDMSPDKRRRVLISRDWYVFGTQTGMRYSDWKANRIKIVQVPLGWDIQFTQQKTGDPVQVPVSAVALRVLEHYNFDMPAGFSPSATLNHVRAAARAAGITKKIGTHTARRTFCTIQERAGVPRSIIMRITGHKTEKDYLRYIGVTYEQNAALMRSANPDMYNLEKKRI